VPAVSFADHPGPESVLESLPEVGDRSVQIALRDRALPKASERQVCFRDNQSQTAPSEGQGRWRLHHRAQRELNREASLHSRELGNTNKSCAPKNEGTEEAKTHHRKYCWSGDDHRRNRHQTYQEKSALMRC